MTRGTQLDIRPAAIIHNARRACELAGVHLQPHRQRPGNAGRLQRIKLVTGMNNDFQLQLFGKAPLAFIEAAFEQHDRCIDALLA